ncbi:hypothetical protein MBLNU230_g4354t1 [Neophaeotheca triangularis]
MERPQVLGSEQPRKSRFWRSAASNMVRHRGDKQDAAVAATSTVTLINDDFGTNSNVLTEVNAYSCLGYNFSWTKKWSIITAVFLVQLSMNFNAAVYANAIPGLEEEFGISKTKAHLPQALFLIMYAIGCELWAPWSEELGRWKILQISLFLVNLWQLPCALAPSFNSIIAGRILGGLSSAGGSVTLGMVADMWEPNEQQHAVNYVVLSSCAGSVLAPILGGFITQYLDWPWVFWVALIFGVVTQIIHFFTPETRSDCLLDKEARRKRKAAQGTNGPDANVRGPNEIRGNIWQRMTLKNVAVIMWRPYQFLITEPIVTWLSLLSGFSDALIFTALDSFGLVLKQWDFTVVQTGLAFIPLLLSYLIGYFAFLPRYNLDRKIMRAGEPYKPERRLWLLLWLVPLETIGLFMFAWCSLGPERNIPWIAPLLCTIPIGIANFAIYLASIDYMVAAYGPYSASATGGNGFARDLLAGVAAFYARPFYTHFNQRSLGWQLAIPSFILSGIAAVLAIPVYVFYIKGESIRRKSKFAQSLADEREQIREERVRSNNVSAAATPAVSRRASLVEDTSSDDNPKFYEANTMEMTSTRDESGRWASTWDPEEIMLANTRSTGSREGV